MKPKQIRPRVVQFKPAPSHFIYLLNFQTCGSRGYMTAKGRFRFNPNLLFILNIYFCFLNLIIRFSTNLNLTRVKILIKIIFFNFHPSWRCSSIIWMKYFSSKVFIPLFLFFIFLLIQSWMKSFHPCVIFDKPYLSHMGLDFNNSHIIEFILASSTQQ
jgi:hypothetical protein